MLPKADQEYVIWKYIPVTYRRFLSPEEAGHRLPVQFARRLLEQMNAEDRELAIDFRLNIIRDFFTNLSEAFLAEPPANATLKDKALVAHFSTPTHQFSSRNLRPILMEHGIKVTNLSSALDELEEDEFLNLIPSEKPKEGRYELTPFGVTKTKRLLKLI